MFASFFFCYYFISFFLSLFSLLPLCVLIFLLPFVFFRVYILQNTMHMLLALFGCKWFGMIYHSSLIPFPSRTGMILPKALFCAWYLFVSSHRHAILLQPVLWSQAGFQGGNVLIENIIIMWQKQARTYHVCPYFILVFITSFTFRLFLTRRRFYPQRSSAQAMVTGVVPSPPRYVPSFLSRIGFSVPTAHRFSSITHALALSTTWY